MTKLGLAGLVLAGCRDAEPMHPVAGGDQALGKQLVALLTVRRLGHG